MNKHIKLFFISLLWLPSSMVQKENLDLIGIWQANSGGASSALRENFRFYKDGKFKYGVSEYDDLNPMRAINGKYTLEKNTLSLQVSSYELMSGFQVTASEPSFQFGSFQLDGGKLTVVKQEDKSPSEHYFKILNSSGKAVILIDNTKYYKLSADPNGKFEK
jgi:hypothetical protein